MNEPDSQLKSIWTTIHGLKMHGRVAVEPAPASDEVIVLVHGLSVSSGYMVPTAKELAPYYHVYAPDLPGYGKSEKPRHILTVPEMADTLAAWMKTLDLPPATLLGNSLGCQTIVDFARRYPQYTKRLILVGPTMDPQARTIHQEAFRLMRDMLVEPLSFYPVVTREYLAAGLRRTIHTLLYAFRDPIEQHLPYIHVPTLVLRGEKDPIVPQRWVEEVNRLLPNSRLVVIPGAAHAVNYNSPKMLGRAIREFMRDFSGSQEG